MTYEIKRGSIVYKNNEKASAREQIVDSARDLLSLKIKMPLGNPNLKLVHTNQCLWTTLPEEFVLENFERIALAIQSTYSRFSGYQTNRWYIEGVTINNNGGDFSIELDVNPFATTSKNYRDDLNSFSKSYVDAFTQKTTSSKTSSNKSSKTVKSVKGKNTSLKGGEGSFIDNLVKKIVGNTTDDLKKAKLIHEHIRSKQKYSFYTDSRYSSPKTCYKNIRHLNCADMSRLTSSMMRSAGVSCYVVQSTCHYYTVLKIGGKLYCSDNASSSSSGRQFNYYWRGSSCRSGSTVKFTGKNCYYRVCGKTPCS